MNNIVNHKTLCSQLQRRLATRAVEITEAEGWKQFYREKSQIEDYRKIKVIIKRLAEDQVRDKMSLTHIRQAEKITTEYSKLYKAYDDACAMIADMADGLAG